MRNWRWLWCGLIHSLEFSTGAGVKWGGGIPIVETGGGGLGFLFLVAAVSDFKLRLPSSEESFLGP